MGVDIKKVIGDEFDEEKLKIFNTAMDMDAAYRQIGAFLACGTDGETRSNQDVGKSLIKGAVSAAKRLAEALLSSQV